MAIKKHSHVAIAKKYAEDVVSGKISACKWVMLACQRQLDDLERQKEAAWPYKFDHTKAERICNVVELFPHVKGRQWAGKNITLEPWQSFIYTTTFGWVKKETGLRRFKTVFIECPRKNGKSAMSAPVGLYMLAVDGEPGSECYSAATSRDQAKIVFNIAKEMARKTPEFCSKFGIEINAHNLCVIQTASKFESLSAESSTLDGLNVHCGIIDELHAHKTRAVYDVIETALGSRSQPLLWNITTAGSNRAGICYEQRTYVTKILEKVHADETYFGIIYTIDDGDDWTDAKTWQRANPNYGVSVYPDDIARLCAKAQQMPSAQNNFLTKRLNVWVNADTAWMSMAAWDKCADTTLNVNMFEGKPCWKGIDLASKIDIAADMSLFEQDGHYYAFGKYYLPEETIENAANSQYSGWVRMGRLEPTPGEVIDFDTIEDDIKDFSSKVEIKSLAYDPFQATQFASHMLEQGFPMVEVRPTVLNFSEPMKQLEALVLSGKFHFDGDPVLTWMVSNVVGHMDNKDNIYPKKERPENKIDGVIALLMALNMAMRQSNKRSIYEERGLVVL